ncbi:IclR family transcriptional regulator [Rhodopseudomonas palustris]|uniref:IclR family transcriptional regulator n=1 Tax=Rhodopseudomonas palustris TaxID=1076 RepID=A0A323UNW4_RHOPL|nr:IclR family transcriptional regulator [Rhodopseudomonas palustris]PZA13997.1 IclR family transcriptional regulator [Rhodopseudomonas palustris]
MGRRSERLCRQGDVAGDGDVIQVVSRAFDVLRCFEGHDVRLGNLEISNRCGLPRSTVSRLTHTLTRMGQLVYLPRDQKYRIGPSAVAMSTSMTRGLQLRNLIRSRLQEVSEQIPGTVGFLIPDRFHLVYLEVARAAHALGLHSTTGSRIAISRSAAGRAYLASLEENVAAALLSEIQRDAPADAALLSERIESDRAMLRERGYVVSCGLFSPHINGIAVPIWSPQYQTYVMATIGVLGAMYDEQRVHDEIAPVLLKLAGSIEPLVQNADGGLVAVRPSGNNKKTIRPEGMNELEAGARRAGPARELRAADGRHRQGQAPA